jgi:hypothetical protein
MSLGLIDRRKKAKPTADTLQKLYVGNYIDISLRFL